MPRITLLILAGALLTAAPAAAQPGGADATTSTWQSANVAYLAGFHWSTPREQRDVVTFEYANRWALGDNFLFLDIANLLTRSGEGTGIGTGRTSLYGEWHTRFSVGRLFGVPTAAGPLADVLIANELNFSGTGMLAHLHGVGADWNAPGFTFLRTNVFLRNDVAQEGATWQVLVAGLVPFRMGRLALTYGGFVDVIGAEGELARSVVSATQLLLDAGAAVGRGRGRIHVGGEFHYGRNQGGLRGSHDTVPQAIIKWVF